ncbi:nuclear transport factor 2 family protein [Flavobacterium microcysteis]|uniref:Nuclear transport factor 2 family protein n=1 Tax=Flavobacterium microcysteis TaxID=2596891 RepID=A0A501Q2B7_9FLAO|nr:nuclear transport factor 2 family protein [Flavobacterium microcysteis]TPD66071.1 nuclear transport factor 2 family protein [Flavobacterium microcysteis]
MKNRNEDRKQITSVLDDYFNGIFVGDTNLLRSVFHPMAFLSGDINGEPYFKTLEQYLEGVKNRKSPNELGAKFGMEIISIEIINTIAVAKTHVPIFEYNYYDLLSLSLIDGKWVIVNKLLTHVNE